MRSIHAATPDGHGQALVLLALMLAGLMAFVGLALDGGQVYVMRGRMQNAADASSVAGVLELAPGGQNTLVWYRINQYAVGNTDVGHGATAFTAQYMPSGVGVAPNVPPPANTRCIQVNPNKTFQTLIISFIGFDTLSAKASAKACYGAVGSVAGAVPWALNLDAANAPEGTPESLGSSVGGGGTYNYESIDTVRDGLGSYRQAFCYGMTGAVGLNRLNATSYDSILSPTFTQDEKDCLNYRIASRPGETWDNFGVNSPRVLILPVMDGSAGNATLKIVYFRAFFLESINVASSIAYGRFVHVVIDGTLDLTGPLTGVFTVKLTQ